MDFQRPFLERYRLLLQDPHVRNEIRKPSREDLNICLANIMNPKGTNDSTYTTMLTLQNYPQGETLKREMDQAVNRIEEFYRKTRAIEDLTISLRGKVYQNTHRLANDEQKLESLVMELNDKFKDVDRLFDAFEGLKRRVSDSYGMKSEREGAREDSYENRMRPRSSVQSDIEHRPSVAEENHLINKLKRELEDEKRKSTVLSKENELLMSENVRLSKGQPKDSNEGIKKQFETIIGRIADLEKLNLGLQEREKSAIMQCNKLEEKAKAAEDSKKLAEEKELALIRENGRLRERIDAIELENRKLKDELLKAQKGVMELRKSNETRSMKEMDPSSVFYEERKRLMEENEKLVNIVSELRREKTTAELKRKLEEEKEEGRPRLITFGQSQEPVTPKEIRDETPRKDKDEQTRRSLRAQRLLNLSAAPSSMNTTVERIEDSNILPRELSRDSQQGDLNRSRSRGKIFPYTATPGTEDVPSVKQELSHSRNYSMIDTSLKNTLLDKPAPRAVVRLSEQHSVNSQPQENTGMNSGKILTGESVLKPYIDVKELIARGKSDQDISLSNIKTFDLKERR